MSDRTVNLTIAADMADDVLVDLMPLMTKDGKEYIVAIEFVEGAQDVVHGINLVDGDYETYTYDPFDKSVALYPWDDSASRADHIASPRWVELSNIASLRVY